MSYATFIIIARYFQSQWVNSWSESFCIVLPRTYLSRIIICKILDGNNPRNIVVGILLILYGKVLTINSRLFNYHH